MYYNIYVTDERVAVIVSGGNADLTDHADLVRTGLIDALDVGDATAVVDADLAVPESSR